MLLYLYRVRTGYLRVRLQGYSPERFLNLCMANQIVIWDLRCVDGFYQFLITVKDFRRVKPLVHKAQVHLKVMGRHGLPFFLYRNRRRKLYGAGVVAFFMILFIMSRFIWNITLEGNRQFTDDALLHCLDSMDVRYGMRRSDVDCDGLEEALRTRYPEIIWVSARISGTRLLIKIKENEAAAAIPQTETEPGDLVAGQDGVVRTMIVRAGKAQVRPGDSVVKGQILVSGTVPILDDAGEEISRQYVRADADIIVRTKGSYTSRIPRLTSQRADTGRIRRGVRLQVGGLSFLWMPPARGTRLWELSRETDQLTVLGDFYLPVWIDRIKAEEYELYERNWTKQELEQQKNRINEEKIRNLMEKGVQIIENNVRILDKNSWWEIQGDFVLDQPDGIRQNMKQEEEIKQLDERN